MGLEVAAGDDVPVDAFECGAGAPQVPEVTAGFFAAAGCLLVEAVVVQPFGEGAAVLCAVEGYAVLGDLVPCDEDGPPAGFAGNSCLPFFVEESSFAVSGAFLDFHGQRYVED